MMMMTVPMSPRVQYLVDNMDSTIQPDNVRFNDQSLVYVDLCIDYIRSFNREREINLFLCNMGMDRMIDEQALEVKVNRHDWL